MTIRIDLPRRALAYLAFAGLVACGGKVVFVEEALDGGGGASTTTTGTTGTGSTTNTGTGAGGFTCSVPIPAGAQQIYDCIAQNGQGMCDPEDSLSVFQAMSDKVNGMVCANGCCTVTNLLSVPCGPDPTQTTLCCYFAFAAVQQECAGGGTGD